MKIFKLNKFSIFSAFAVLVFVFLNTGVVHAAGQCFCRAQTGPECRNSSQASCVSDTNCSWQASNNDCDNMVREAKAQDYEAQQTAEAGALNGGLVGKFLPRCVTQSKLNLKSECGDVTIFLVLMFNIINYLFGIIGGVALLFFVYGGFVFILSEGSSDKVAKGKGIIVAAIMGIIISFSGYALVKFVGKIAGIEDQYKLK